MSKKPINIYFFAHQDDECGILNEIIENIQNNEFVYCVYMTTGVECERSSNVRNNESKKVLQSIGVKKENILFAGDILSINDNDLILNLNKAKSWILNWIRNKEVNSVFVPCWEGGHPDHDSLNAIVANVFFQKKEIHKIRQFPLYNGQNCIKPFFNVFKPIPENGVVYKKKIKLKNRLLIISKFLSYPSQISSWVGLLFPMSYKILFFGRQFFQNINIKRLNHRPHKGKLYYEMRNFSKWKLIKEKIDLFNQY